MYEDLKNITPAESSISLRLAEIRQPLLEAVVGARCTGVDPRGPVERPDGTNPYNCG